MILLPKKIYFPCIFKEKSPVYTLKLPQKSDFQPSTIKPDNRGRPTVQTGQI